MVNPKTDLVDPHRTKNGQNAPSCSVGTCNYLHFFFKLMNNVLVAYLYKPENAPSLCALMLHLLAVTKVRCHLRFFFNLGHQTKQYLNLVDVSIGESKKFL